MKTTFLLSLLIALPIYAAEPTFNRLSQVRDLYPHLSPDGRRIVFQSNRSGNNQVWLMNRDGTGLVQLTDIPGQGAETPVWSPDGQRIAYAAYVGENNNDVFVMKPDGSDNTQLTSGRAMTATPTGQRTGIAS